MDLSIPEQAVYLASRPPYNRMSQAEFRCKACGMTANADVNAARNIRAQGICKLSSELAGLTAQPESRRLY